jgi:hypothetical protein
MWLRMQAAYDLAQARQQGHHCGAQLEHTWAPRGGPPYEGGGPRHVLTTAIPLQRLLDCPRA